MELIEPDRIWSDEIGDYIISGGNVAFVVIADTTQDSSRVKVLRQWGEYYPESWVVEYPYSIYVLELFYVTPSAESYINVGLSFHARPLSAFDWGFGAQIIRATDSFNQDNYGFGFNGFTLWRFFNSTKLDVAAKFGLDVDFPFKTDDDGHSVNTALLSAQIAFVTEYPVSRNLDFTSNFGYRWGKKTSEWQFSVEDESLSAYWKGDAPVVNNTGFVLSFGFKIYVF
jgi:hypothetical protein